MTYSPSSHACPRCEIHLYVGQASGVTLHGCGRCGGIWLASACARRIAEALPTDALELAGRASRSAQADVDTSPPIMCVVCAKPTTRTRAAAAGVELDVCGVHGTWYDRHELEQIAKVISQAGWGGLRAGKAKVAGAAAVAGAAVAAGAVAGAAASDASTQSAQSMALEVAAEVGTEVALEVGAEVVIDAGFDLVGSILSAIFD